MGQNPKNNFFKYVNDFLLILKKITIEIYNNLILFDLKFILENIKNIFISNKKYLLFFILIIPFVFIVIMFMVISGVFFYFYYFYLYLKYNYNIHYKKNKNKKIIKYKNDKINFLNPYSILLKKYILEKPKKIAFYIFYNNLYIIYNLKNKNLNKNYENIKFIFIIIYNIVVRILFLLLTGVPFIVIKASTYITIKTKNSKEFKFENINTKIKFILFNCLIDLASEIELQIKKMRIIITKKKTIFNSKDLLNKDILKNFWLEFLSRVKDISNFQNAASQLEMNTYLSSIKNIKNEKKIYKELKYRDGFLKEKLITTKPHISLFLKIPNSENLIYINETSKNELWVWDNNLKILKKIDLYFWHQGSINKKKDTFFTPPILTENNKIISENSINNIIKNTNKFQTIKNGMTVNLLLNVDQTLFRTEYVEEENKNIITIKENQPTLLEEINEITINSKNNKDMIKILDSFKIAEEFIKNNQEIINEIPNDMKVFFIQSCLNNFYNEKSNIFKEIVTKIYFNK